MYIVHISSRAALTARINMDNVHIRAGEQREGRAMTSGWNYGAIFDAVAQVVPGERPALIHGAGVTTWRRMTERSNNLARNLAARGVRPGDKVAFYMRNCAEYLEAVVAVCKGRFVHVNVNYRYVAAELTHLLADSDAVVCIYEREFAAQVRNIRADLPGVGLWIEVGEGAPSVGAARYEDLASDGGGEPLRGVGRTGADQFMIYTGGTTGLPRGVVWSHAALWMALGGNAAVGAGPCQDVGELCARVADNPAPPRTLVLPPLMHGAGLLSAMTALAGGGAALTLPSKSFDPHEALAMVEARAVSTISMVGDAFARPLIEALDAAPGRYDLSSLAAIISGGVMWTPQTKAAFLRHNGRLALIDLLSSSEAIGLGHSVTTAMGGADVAKFSLGSACKVFTEAGEEVAPGSGGSGFVAVAGFLPEGYYKDSEKSARTFRTFGGVRYSLPGDVVRLETDGSVTFLGRGSNCINTAGEKVFPEEVEETLKRHPSVADCLVVGLDDARWGQMVVAVVEAAGGAAIDETALRSHAAASLAAYKLPKRIVPCARLPRSPSGKPDYAAARGLALGAA